MNDFLEQSGMSLPEALVQKKKNAQLNGEVEPVAENGQNGKAEEVKTDAPKDEK